MLRLLSVKEIREHVFLVTLDNKGKTLNYEFTWTPPASTDGVGRVGSPIRIDYDLLEYEAEELKDKPGGALWVPAVSKLLKLVRRHASGEHIDYPIVLDER